MPQAGVWPGIPPESESRLHFEFERTHYMPSEDPSASQTMYIEDDHGVEVLRAPTPRVSVRGAQPSVQLVPAPVPKSNSNSLPSSEIYLLPSFLRG